MLAELLAIEPGGRAPIGRTEHEEDAASPPRVRHGDRALVPSDVRAVRHAREGGAPGEGDENLMTRRDAVVRPAGIDTGVPAVERESPAAVQVEPLGALEIGARMLGERDGVARRALRARGGMRSEERRVGKEG